VKGLFFITVIAAILAVAPAAAASAQEEPTVETSAAGISLRDTHASLLAKRGVPLEVVSKRLGHSNISITANRYLHVYQSQDVAAASVLNDLCA
jgi:integrase